MSIRHRVTKLISKLMPSAATNKKRKKRRLPFGACEYSDDQIELSLPGLHIKVNRETTLDIPHEVTVVVPRAELRKTCSCPEPCSCRKELIYSSITIVHAPRHPLAGPPAPPPEIPPSTSATLYFPHSTGVSGPSPASEDDKKK
ncbi:hypothetical protein [Calderihabitans maritimus]|uniref:Uncharacterized protein n=1 Tax=Calderihabitans maritimus TaxID=1246530 RepID=A0A1Z5HPW3_9FIRM|nr:hypothetical protein [Calderihabitans maritimus]GAW91569.1 hypothetical protein Thit_0676 [Calderihabitans maritimus]